MPSFEHLWLTVPIIEVDHLTQYTYQPRTWKERLFSCPWNPMRSWKLVEEPQACFVTGAVAQALAGTKAVILCHPSLVPKLLEGLEDA